MVRQKLLIYSIFHKPIGLLFFVVMSVGMHAQRFEHVKAFYANDTLIITYDLSGNQKIDSLEIKVSSYKTRKTYKLMFLGDANYNINPGKNKVARASFHRDSLPDNGESLQIRLKGWTKYTPVHKKRKFDFSWQNISKVPLNPRFSLINTVGLLTKSSEFSKMSITTSSTFYYNPTDQFGIGAGLNYISLSDSLKHYSSVAGYISAKYKLSEYLPSTYVLMNYGFDPLNDGPLYSIGFGYEGTLLGPIGYDISARINKFSGDYNFGILSFNAGLSINMSSRKRFKKDKTYKFREYLIYVETGLNYFNKMTPSLSFDIAYNISPFYTQGLGISLESINYQLSTEIYSSYYSSYYQKDIEYIAGIQNFNLKLFIAPIYFNGRLFFSLGKVRPYLLWKYGITLYSHVNEGDLKNGFVADAGIGFQISLNKHMGLNISTGVKYFNNKYSIETIEYHQFGTTFLKAGIVF